MPIKIGSTINTYYSVPFPTFGYTITLGVSAAYIDPIGESDTLWCYNFIPLLWALPVEVDFEDSIVYSSEMTARIMEGNDNWELNDSNFYSQSHSASYKSNLANSSASLITTEIGLTSNQTPSLSFMGMLPHQNGQSDTLKLYYLSAGIWVQITEPIFNIDDWQLFTISLELLPLSFHIAFEAIAGGGDGIYLDDIIFEDKAVNVQDQKLFNPLMKVEQNPVISLLTIDLNLIEESLCNFDVYTIERYPVKSVEKHIIENGNQKISIDIADLNAGLYILMVSLNKKIITRRFVKI